MDSINQQQQEENYKDLFGEEARKKIKENEFLSWKKSMVEQLKQKL